MSVLEITQSDTYHQFRLGKIEVNLARKLFINSKGILTSLLEILSGTKEQLSHYCEKCESSQKLSFYSAFLVIYLG